MYKWLDIPPVVEISPTAPRNYCGLGSPLNARFVESLFLDAGVPYRWNEQLIDNRKRVVIAIIDGVRVGFFTGVEGRNEELLNDINYNELDLMFGHYSYKMNFTEIPNYYPFSPPAFGSSSWQTYHWATGLKYLADGNNVIAYMGRPDVKGSCDSKYRQAAKSQLEQLDVKLLSDFLPPRQFYKQVEIALVAVGCPGVSTAYLDRTVIELMAIGCCVIHPRINYPLPGGGLKDGVHYLACQEDYTDLPRLLTNQKYKFSLVGQNAKQYFYRYLTAQPLLAYIRSIASKYKKTKEYLKLTENDITSIEEVMRNMRHVERYRLARWHSKGNVVDFGCGCGYGTKILSENPDVKTVVGIDINAEVLDFARENFASDKLKFVDHIEGKYDTLVAIEVIEHLNDIETFIDLVKSIVPINLILTFPVHKTTHFNPYHKRDINKDELLSLLNDYNVIKDEVIQTGETQFLVLERNKPLNYDRISALL